MRTMMTNLWDFDVDKEFVLLSSGLHFFDVFQGDERRHLDVKVARLFVALLVLADFLRLGIDRCFVVDSFFRETEGHDFLVKVLRYVDGQRNQVDFKVSLDRDPANGRLFPAINSQRPEK